jgi:hypothetical protein
MVAPLLRLGRKPRLSPDGGNPLGDSFNQKLIAALKTKKAT